MTNNDRK